MTRAHAEQKSFGDFQTPPDLARRVCERLARSGRFRAVLEPTCGEGAFLEAAFATLEGVEAWVGLDVNAAHLEVARARLDAARARLEATPRARPRRREDFRLELIEADVFTFDLGARLAALPSPLLIVGNPPWVTNADQGRRGATNLPRKHNLKGSRGLEARTGRANFDVAEWILLHLIERLAGRAARLALLVKTSTARRVLLHAWQTGAPIVRAALRRIDAAQAFGVAVDAGLFELELGPEPGPTTCAVFADLEAEHATSCFGLVDGVLASNVEDYARHRALDTGRRSPWRSGVKHDCAKVLELASAGSAFVNGLGERCELEHEHVFPLLKSTDLARDASPRRWVLVPQRSIGEDTASLARRAPKIYEYLSRNAAHLERRKSSIYRGRPPFSIFGVGPYTFAPWKVAISGLHKTLAFRVVPPHAGRPTLFDDTCYFLPFEDEASAREAQRRLDSAPSRALLAALIFWDAKRPVTKEVLERLDLDALGRASRP